MAEHKQYGASRFRRAVVHFIGGRVAQAIGRALLILVVVRLLPVEDYGAYMLVIGVAEMLLLLASLGVVSVAQRYVPEVAENSSRSTLGRFVTVLSAIQMLLLVVVAGLTWMYWPTIAGWLSLTDAQIVAMELSALLFFLIPAFRFVEEILEAMLEQGKSQVSRALMPIGRVAVLGVFVALGTHVDLALMMSIDVGVTLFCLLMAYYYLYVSVRDFKGQGTASVPVREIVQFSWHMAGANLFSAAGNPGAFRLAISNSLGLAETGLFAFLQSMERLISRNLPGTLLRGVVRPVMVAKAAAPGGMAAVEAGAWFLMKMNLAITLGGFVAVVAAGDELVMLASGGKFPGAGTTLLIFLAVLAIAAQRSVIEMVLQITRQTATLRATAFLVPIGLFLAWYLSRYGLNAAVGAIMITTFAANAIAVRGMRHGERRISFAWGDYLRIGIPALAAGALGYGLALVMNGYGAAGIALIVFTGALALGKPFQHRELALLERGIGKKIARIMRRFSRDTGMPAQEASK